MLLPPPDECIADTLESLRVAFFESLYMARYICSAQLGICAISQFQDSKNAQRNLEIAQIPKLRGTYIVLRRVRTPRSVGRSADW